MKLNYRNLALTLVACLSAANVALAQNFATTKPLVYDIRSYGAKGDGKTLDTDAINAGIEAVSTAGGGTLHFPTGIYPSFSIHLKSNVVIYLDQGAVILAAGQTLGGPNGGGGPGGGGRRGRGTATASAPTTVEAPAAPVSTRPFISPPIAPEILNLTPAYDLAETNPHESSQFGANQDFGHSHWHNSLFWGENLVNVSILGPGMIDGNGLAYNAPAGSRGVGNKVFAIKTSRNVTMRDITMYRGGHFCILATAVDNFTIDNVKFDTNRDAIDVVSCKNVRISNCYVNSPIDDGICLKADYSLGAPRDCENITITNCQVSGYRTGTLLDGTYDRLSNANYEGQGPTGRIKFGTESNGGFKNITISNCIFDHCRGLAIESVDGGVIEDVTVTNLAMREINSSPIFIRLGNRHRSPLGPETPVAQIRRINISDISASGCNPNQPALISGIPGHPIEDLRISNVRIAYRGGGTAEQAARVIPENENAYPEPTMFGILSASGFFIRHVKGLEMHHINITFDKDDARPVFVLNDVVGADFQHIRAPRAPGVALFSLTKVSDFSTQFVQGFPDTRKDSIEQEILGK